MCNLVLFLPKRSKPIFLFGPVSLWKTKCNKTLMCFFLSSRKRPLGEQRWEFSLRIFQCEWACTGSLLVTCYPTRSLWPSLITPHTSLTCKFLSHMKNSSALVSAHKSAQWENVFCFQLFHVFSRPDFRNCDRVLNIKWHLIIISGKNRLCREFLLPWTVVGSSLI